MTALDLGLRPGEVVRFRRRAGGHWHEGVVAGLEKDGSVTVHDLDGAARSLPPERLEVRTRGRRGAPRWEPLVRRAGREEQLTLW
ncbi:MAG: hypothetical protein IPM45_05670 [Acidimicrobiales bacterium]|nr:hypothetical protein [Acidimicrobiales bacterium]